MAKIILKTNTIQNQINCDTVKLTPEALSVLQRLQLRSGLSARRIVSDILLQAEHMVQVEEGDER